MVMKKSLVHRTGGDLKLKTEKEILQYYGSLPLPELRRRQRLNELQISLAYAQKKTETLVRLQKDQDLLARTVDGKSFKK